MSATPTDNHSVPIEVRLSKLDQLFISLDPTPFLERDLDDDAEDFIAGSARELPAELPIRIVLHLPENELQKAGELGIEGAITRHFDYRATQAGGDLKELFRNGRRYLAIAVRSFWLASLQATLFAWDLAKDRSPEPSRKA